MTAVSMRSTCRGIATFRVSRLAKHLLVLAAILAVILALLAFNRLQTRVVCPTRYEPQLMERNRTATASREPKLKKILVLKGFFGQFFGPRTKGRQQFLLDGCPVNTCTYTTNTGAARDADAIVFWEGFGGTPRGRRPPHQVWVVLHMESPLRVFPAHARRQYNWTATYRSGSDLHTPYGQWRPYAAASATTAHPEQPSNYAANKTKQVAWFVSNCRAFNDRLQYAHELAKHIQVDIYGHCGKFTCRRSDNRCLEMLNTDYKFYLAFENAHCEEYITEKFFLTGLRQRVLPVVLGARPSDYARAAPPRSYLHVDEFASPKHLAEYLHKLDRDDALYNSYFRWKSTGEVVPASLSCRLCAKLHEQARAATWHTDFKSWWWQEGICTRKRPWPSQAGESPDVVRAASRGK